MTRRSTPIQRRSVVRTQWSVADEDTSKNQGSSLNISQAVAPGPRGVPVDELMVLVRACACVCAYEVRALAALARARCPEFFA
jgi:hypothetical protein